MVERIGNAIKVIAALEKDGRLLRILEDTEKVLEKNNAELQKMNLRDSRVWISQIIISCDTLKCELEITLASDLGRNTIERIYNKIKEAEDDLGVNIKPLARWSSGAKTKEVKISYPVITSYCEPFIIQIDEHVPSITTRIEDMLSTIPPRTIRSIQKIMDEKCPLIWDGELSISEITTNATEKNSANIVTIMKYGTIRHVRGELDRLQMMQKIIATCSVSDFIPTVDKEEEIMILLRKEKSKARQGKFQIVFKAS